MIKLKKLLTASILSIGLATAPVLVSPASADGIEPPAPPTCVKQDGTTVCKAEASSASGTHINIKNHDVAKAEGKTVVYFIKANGASKKQMDAKKIRLPKQRRLWTSYYNTSHQEVWHWKTYPKGKVFVKGKDGWFHDPECYNKVKIKTKNQVPKRDRIYGEIVIKQFVTAVATARADALGKGWASASCKTANSSAYGMGYYEIAGHAVSRAKARATSWVKAQQKARNSINRKIESVRSEAAAKAMASASVKAVGTAAANAHCEYSESRTTTPVTTTCESVYGPGYTGSYPSCTKDGTATPPPPSDAPGPNPPPSGGTGDPGSNQCYDPETGQPVDPGTPGAWC